MLRQGSEHDGARIRVEALGRTVGFAKSSLQGTGRRRCVIDDPVRTMVGMAFVRILVRDHKDGGTGETRMGKEDERRDPVRAAQHRACTVARRRPSMLEGTCDAGFSQAGRDALALARLAFLDDPGGRKCGGGSCPSNLSVMRSYFAPA